MRTGFKCPVGKLMGFVAKFKLAGKVTDGPREASGVGDRVRPEPAKYKTTQGGSTTRHLKVRGALMIKALFGLALRQAMGLVAWGTCGWCQG